MEHEADRDEAVRPVTESPSPQEPGEADPRLSGPDEDRRPDPSTPPPGADAAARPQTGEPRVDAALRLLDRLPGLPVRDHPELFAQVHAQLTDVLGELDSGSAGPAGAHGS
jgi:hypothetical protein